MSDGPMQIGSRDVVRGLVRGSFQVYGPTDSGGTRAQWSIPFRFNPETLTRTVTLQVAVPPVGVQGGQSRATGGDDTQARPDTSGGTLKETFSALIRLDLDDREESPTGMNTDWGVAPEIAAIEELLYPVETEQQQTSDGRDGTAVVSAPPTVVFAWGERMFVPVRIASLKIDEMLYNSALYPTRAEIDVAMEVLGTADALADRAVAQALRYTGDQRRSLAGHYYDYTSAQGVSFVIG